MLAGSHRITCKCHLHIIASQLLSHNTLQHQITKYLQTTLITRIAKDDNPWNGRIQDVIGPLTSTLQIINCQCSDKF